MQDKNVKKGPRASVSAECFGAWNSKKNFVAPVHAKSATAMTAIRDKLKMTFMFNQLDEREQDVVILAMEERNAVNSEKIIQQGDEGDCLYVVGSGTLTCTRVQKEGQEPTFLKTYQPGEAFGELALLYNAPRAATITATEDCQLWKLDRDTFNHIVKDAASKKRVLYDTFLSNVSILSTMEPYERTKLADALKQHKFKQGEYIIKEGDDGNDLYLI